MLPAIAGQHGEDRKRHLDEVQRKGVNGCMAPLPGIITPPLLKPLPSRRLLPPGGQPWDRWWRELLTPRRATDSTFRPNWKTS